MKNSGLILNQKKSRLERLRLILFILTCVLITLNFLVFNKSNKTTNSISETNREFNISPLSSHQYSDKELTDKSVKPDMNKIFEHRRRVMELGCYFLDEIAKLMADENVEFEQLIKFHRDIYELKLKAKKSSSCRTRHQNLTSVRRIDSPYYIGVCLPPKCGTSNWQKALDVLQYIRYTNLI